MVVLFSRADYRVVIRFPPSRTERFDDQEVGDPEFFPPRQGREYMGRKSVAVLVFLPYPRPGVAFFFLLLRIFFFWAGAY